MPQEVASTERPRAWLLSSAVSPMTAFTVPVIPDRDTHIHSVVGEGGVERGGEEAGITYEGGRE